MKCVRFTEQVLISAMHSLENPDLSDRENREIFGICYQKHGHDYLVAAVLEAEIDARTGLSVDRDVLRRVLVENLHSKCHGKFLNRLYEPTSGEALSVFWFEELRPLFERALPGVRLVGLNLQETRKNWFSYSP